MAERSSIPPAEQRGGRLDHIVTTANTIGLTALMAVRSAGEAVVRSIGQTAQERAEEWFAESGYQRPASLEVAETDDGREAINNAERVTAAVAARVALKAYGGGATAFIEERPKYPQDIYLDPVQRRELIDGWNALHPDYPINN